MKNLILSLFTIFFSFNVFSYSLDEAYYDFYNSQQISSAHCGKNIFHFLNYLNQKGISYGQGFVVSVHDDSMFLNHFDARWGSPEKYENGIPYLRSNWYFHVFVILDGRAFDFSQTGPKIQNVKNYLHTSYLPEHKTKNILMQGRLDQSIVLKSYINMNMKVYRLKDYAGKMGPAFYSGEFVELFNIVNSIEITSFTGSLRDSLSASSIQRAGNGKTIIKNPMLKTDSGLYPLKADAKKICNAFGFMGAIENETQFRLTDNQIMLKLYTKINSPNIFNIDLNHDISISSKEEKTQASLKFKDFHFATQVTCTDLTFVLNLL